MVKGGLWCVRTRVGSPTPSRLVEGWRRRPTTWRLLEAHHATRQPPTLCFARSRQPTSLPQPTPHIAYSGAKTRRHDPDQKRPKKTPIGKLHDTRRTSLSAPSVRTLSTRFAVFTRRKVVLAVSDTKGVNQSTNLRFTPFAPCTCTRVVVRSSGSTFASFSAQLKLHSFSP